jgi:hypothetical protein
VSANLCRYAGTRPVPPQLRQFTHFWVTTFPPLPVSTSTGSFQPPAPSHRSHCWVSSDASAGGVYSTGGPGRLLFGQVRDGDDAAAQGDDARVVVVAGVHGTTVERAHEGPLSVRG